MGSEEQDWDVFLFPVAKVKVKVKGACDAKEALARVLDRIGLYAVFGKGGGDLPDDVVYVELTDEHTAFYVEPARDSEDNPVGGDETDGVWLRSDGTEGRER